MSGSTASPVQVRGTKFMEGSSQILSPHRYWSRLGISCQIDLAFSHLRLPPSLLVFCLHLVYANVGTNFLLVPKVFKLGIGELWAPIAWPLVAAAQAAGPCNTEHMCSSSSCLSVAWDQEPNTSFNNSTAL